jgi:hypothetical protein
VSNLESGDNKRLDDIDLLWIELILILYNITSAFIDIKGELNKHLYKVMINYLKQVKITMEGWKLF